MSRPARLLAGSCLFLLLISSTGSLSAQPAKKVLAFSDSDVWRTASTPVLSPDGTYAAYAVWPGEGDGESVVRHIATGKELKFPRGGGVAAVGPKFTPDGKRVLLSLTPTKVETDKAKADKVKADEAPQTTLAVVELATGQIADKFSQSGPFFSAGEGAGFVVYRKPTRPEPAKDKDDEKAAPTGPMGGKGGGGKGKGQLPKGGGGAGANPAGGETYGSDLHIRDLASKNERIIPDVSQFTLSKDGQLLIYAVASRRDETNGVYAINPRSGGSTATIKVGPGKYAGLTWDEKQTKLAFLYDASAVAKSNVAPPPRLVGTTVTAPVMPTPASPPQWRAFVWDRNAKVTSSSVSKLSIPSIGGLGAILSVALATNAPSAGLADEVLGPTTPGQRTGWGLSGGSLSFSADGSRLFVNTAPPRQPTPPASAPRPDDFQLDLWHWQDARLQPMQKLQAAADQAKTYSAVVHLESKQFRQLSDDTMTVGQPPLGSDWALGSDDRKYASAT
ncbi:MAG TPA: hypothetical protein VG122_11455, partial [Gemmata sp.]|nr:hypothetical protein [Gemmata sp.]